MVADVGLYKKAVLWRRNARCRLKIRYVSKFTAASRGFPCESTTSCMDMLRGISSRSATRGCWVEMIGKHSYGGIVPVDDYVHRVAAGTRTGDVNGRCAMRKSRGRFQMSLRGMASLELRAPRPRQVRRDCTGRRIMVVTGFRVFLTVFLHGDV